VNRHATTAFTGRHTWSFNKVLERRGKSGKYLIAELHRGRLQSNSLGKLCVDASALYAIQNSFGIDFVGWRSQLPFYYS
jgi:hypothetical protein